MKRKYILTAGIFFFVFLSFTFLISFPHITAMVKNKPLNPNTMTPNDQVNNTQVVQCDNILDCINANQTSDNSTIGKQLSKCPEGNTCPQNVSQSDINVNSSINTKK